MNPKVQTEAEPYYEDLKYEDLTPEQKQFMEDNPELFFDPNAEDDGIDYEFLLDELEAQLRGERPPGIRIESYEQFCAMLDDAARRRNGDAGATTA